MKYFGLILFQTLFLINCATSKSHLGSTDAGSYLGEWEEVDIVLDSRLKEDERPPSIIAFLEKEEGIYAKIQINGWHMCSTEGYVDIDKNIVRYNSASKRNLSVPDNSNAENTNPCKLTLENKNEILTITHQSEGCRSDCGANNSFTHHKFKKKK